MTKLNDPKIPKATALSASDILYLMHGEDTQSVEVSVLDARIQAADVVASALDLAAAQAADAAAIAGLVGVYQRQAVYDARDYGIFPTNAAAINDTRIATAIAAIVAAGGGTVYFSPGNYDIVNPIVLPNSVNLCGAGDKSGLGISSIRATAAIAGGVIQVIGTSPDFEYGHVIEKINIRCNSLAYYGVQLDRAIYTNTLRNLKITLATQAGIYMASAGCWGNLVDRCYISLCQRGIYLGTDANAVMIINTSIHSSVGAGIYLLTNTAVGIKGCAIEKNGTGGAEQYGIAIYGARPWHIEGCYFEGNGTDAGVDILANQDGSGNGVNGGVVTACYFNGLDTETDHALSVAYGTVTVVGGFSDRHASTTTALGTSGAINNYGCISNDPGGF